MRLWSSETVAADRVLTSASPEARMVFALGPARAGPPAEHRAALLLARLEPELTALRWGQQVHGRLVASVAGDGAREIRGAACVGRCDALITAEARLGLLVWTADCVPVLLAGGGVIAAVHAGWRGTAVDVVGAVVKRFHDEYGIAADMIRASLGPAISGPAYPVGSEVIDALRRLGIEDRLWRRDCHVDLRALLAARLTDLGLCRHRIETVGPCTASTPWLASYRRDGEAAGRQWSMVYRPS